MTKTSVTWTQKVLAKFNLSEEGKVGLYGDVLVREWKKGIRDANREIKSLEVAYKDAKEDALEKLEDLKECYKNAFLEVDMDKISTSTDRKNYTREFTRSILYLRSEVKDFEAYIDTLTSEYSAKVESLKKKIEVTEELLAEVENK